MSDASTAARWQDHFESRIGKFEISRLDRSRQTRRPRIGLALSGGGAKSAAHIGVLDALVQAGVSIDMVAGTSAGAMAGLFFCDGYRPEEMARLVKAELSVSRIWKLIPGGLYWQLARMLKSGRLRAMLERNVRARRFADLAVPFFATATDLVSGERVVLQSGEVIPAVMASMCLPGFSFPVLHQGRTLVDGGVLHNFPADVLVENGADIVIGVDLSGCNAPATEWSNWQPENGVLDVLRRAWATQNRELTRSHLAKVDVVIRPNVAGFGIADLLEADRLIDHGRRAGAKAIPLIHRATAEWQARSKRRFARLFAHKTARCASC